VLRLALRGAGHPVLVTDAMPPVGGTRSSFSLYGETISAADGRSVREDGTLAGSVLDMASAVNNTVRMLGVPLSDALRFAALNPARAIGLDDTLGKLAPGYRADMVAFEPEEVRVIDTWVAGSAVT
jgi:N-acetylglucosamine-6-phosphate deacetylase